MTAGETPSGMVGARFESLFTVDCFVERVEMEICESILFGKNTVLYRGFSSLDV